MQTKELFSNLSKFLIKQIGIFLYIFRQGQLWILQWTSGGGCHFHVFKSLEKLFYSKLHKCCFSVQNLLQAFYWTEGMRIVPYLQKAHRFKRITWETPVRDPGRARAGMNRKSCCPNASRGFQDQKFLGPPNYSQKLELKRNIGQWSLLWDLGKTGC